MGAPVGQTMCVPAALAMPGNIVKNRYASVSARTAVGASDPIGAPVSTGTLVVIVKLTTVLGHVIGALRMGSSALVHWKVWCALANFVAQLLVLHGDTHVRSVLTIWRVSLDF